MVIRFLTTYSWRTQLDGSLSIVCNSKLLSLTSSLCPFLLPIIKNKGIVASQKGGICKFCRTVWQSGWKFQKLHYFAFNFVTLFPHPQKWTIDLLFSNNRIHKHVANFKTLPPPHPSLPFGPLNIYVRLLNSLSAFKYPYRKIPIKSFRGLNLLRNRAPIIIMIMKKKRRSHFGSKNLAAFLQPKSIL